MGDLDVVGRAQHAAVRLEQAWTRWRLRHGLADAAADPVASYVGYSLTEPMGEPRVVIGVDAAEAEFLASFLDRLDVWDDGTGARAPASAVSASAVSASAVSASAVSASAGLDAPGLAETRVRGTAAPVGAASVGAAGRWSPAGGDALGPDRTGRVRVPAPAVGSDLLPAPADMAPASRAGGGQRSGWSGGLAAELAGWSSGELPGQATQQLAAWAAGRPELSAERRRDR